MTSSWPELFLIGAPKCGTTALAHYLADHPGIAFSRPKEPCFFATDLPRQRLVTDRDAYLRLFPRAGVVPRLRAEGSVWYLYSQAAVPNILKVRPDARFVVLLRNPVDAGHALHYQKLRSLDEDVSDFETAFRLQDERRQGRHVPATCRESHTLLYGEVCRFGAQIARLYEHVPPERLKVVLFEDLNRDAGAVYREVLAFAGLPDDRRARFERVNESSRARSAFVNLLARRPSLWRQRATGAIRTLLGVRELGVSAALKKLNTVRAPRPPLRSAFRQELVDFYADDVRLLAQLLRRNLDAWLPPAGEGQGA